MKLRHKIPLVIAAFTLFYIQLPWMYGQCAQSDADCTVFVDLINWTRMGIYSGNGLWNTGSGEEQIPTISDYIRINQNFILTMIVTPSAIIAGIVLWDKRK